MKKKVYNSRGQKLGKHSIIKNPEQNFTTHPQTQFFN